MVFRDSRVWAADGEPVPERPAGGRPACELRFQIPE